jgi:di/tricarboxylate transporter
MGWEAWFTGAVTALVTGLLIFTRYPPDGILVGAVSLLLAVGILDPVTALAGLGNPGLVTVAVLFVVVAGLRHTGAIGLLVEGVLGRPRDLARAQLRLMLPAAGLSAFLNNTPVVALFLPAVREWARRHRLPLSRLLMPLSFATILGGTVTLIGTSTNLVVNGLTMTEAGLPGFDLFAPAPLGLVILAAGLVYLLTAGRWLLPDRIPVIGEHADPRQYTLAMRIEPGSPLVGQTIEGAGLRGLPGMYLVEIEREDEVLPAIAPHQKLKAEDRLVFAGILESVVDLYRFRGLVPATSQLGKLALPRPERCLVEAVVSDSCALVGKSIREGRFRNRYNAAVIAVARNGEQVRAKMGDIVLRPGDTLLLETDPSFAEQQRDSRDFFLVSRIDDSSPPRHERAGLAIAILAAMVLAVATGLTSMLVAALLAAGALLMTGCLRPAEARRAVDWQVLIVIAAAFGLGGALQQTGVAQAVAQQLIALAGGSPLLTLAMVYLVTNLLTEMITNNAAAVLVFPIALKAAQTLGVDFTPFAITLMIAASASFATPIGYQVNLMVYGPGGYRYADFLRVGLPLNLLAGGLTIALAPLIWPFAPVH